jgi:hypothetical protein
VSTRLSVRHCMHVAMSPVTQCIKTSLHKKKATMLIKCSTFMVVMQSNCGETETYMLRHDLRWLLPTAHVRTWHAVRGA